MTARPITIESRRLVIRSYQVSDSEALYEAVRESLPDLLKWMPWATRDFGLVEARSFVRRSIKNFARGSDYTMGIFDKRGCFVGSCGLHATKDPYHRVPMYEVGYWCRSSLHGRGYATEALRALTRFGFAELKANRLEISCDSRNSASERVMIKAGYQREGLLRNSQRDCNGRLTDNLIYARVRPARRARVVGG